MGAAAISVRSKDIVFFFQKKIWSLELLVRQMSASLPMKTHGASWLPAFLSEV